MLLENCWKIGTPSCAEGERKEPLLPFNLPYQPIRQLLYNRTDLFEGFNATEAATWGKTLDFRIYKHFIQEGGHTPNNPYMGMMQALHDNSITHGIYKLIGKRKVAAIMGNHKMGRDAAVYRDIALLARRLTGNGILMCTGGGPGAMEAAHLGALLAKLSSCRPGQGAGQAADSS
jgi:hypothetical protein